eukprot:747940-Hanusia_phi.AAC.1
MNFSEFEILIVKSGAGNSGTTVSATKNRARPAGSSGPVAPEKTLSDKPGIYKGMARSSLVWLWLAASAPCSSCFLPTLHSPGLWIAQQHVASWHSLQASSLRSAPRSGQGSACLRMQDKNTVSGYERLGKEPAIVLGDVATFLIFAAIGRGSHGSSEGSIFLTAAPFMLAWFALAPALGAYRKANNRMDVIKGVLPAVILAAPAGCALRGALQDHMPALPFWIISFVSISLLMSLWRLVHFQLQETASTLDGFVEAITEDID